MTMNRAMMRSLAALCLLAVVALPLAGRAAPATPSFPKLNARVIDSYVLPRFNRLADTSGKLAEDLALACNGNKKATRVVKRD
ncbi:MAG: hypothetical protein Q8K85_18415, partial [Hyphomicrobium sp.]|nr:hypothetical protein [Hyphomicrobium sp.]